MSTAFSICYTTCNPESRSPGDSVRIVHPARLANLALVYMSDWPENGVLPAWGHV